MIDIHDIRRRLGELYELGRPMPQWQLGRLIGKSQPTIGRWERDPSQVDEVYREVLESYADGTRAIPDDFFCR